MKGSAWRKSRPKKRRLRSWSSVGTMRMLLGGAFSGNHIAANCVNVNEGNHQWGRLVTATAGNVRPEVT